MKRFLFVFLFACPFSGWQGMCQTVYETAGNNLSMAGTGVANVNAFSPINNAGTLAFLENTCVGLSAKNHYLIEDLNQYVGTAALPTSFGVFGVSVYYFGDDAFNESQIGLAYSRKLAENTSMGVKLNYFATEAAFADKASMLYPEIGLYYKLTEHLDIGTKAANLFSQKLDTPFENQLHPFISIGANYHPADELTLTIQADERIDDGFSARLGVQYRAMKQLAVMAGFSTHPATMTAGLNLHLSGLDVSIGAAYHTELGTSPHSSLSYDFKK